MTWPNHTINGTEYDLSHLGPFIVPVTPKAPNAPTYQVRVSFGLHTFTRDIKNDDCPSHYVATESETRCFCLTRYQCSLLLPAIIQGATKAHFSQGRNFLFVRDLAGHNGPYAIFFDVTAAKQSGYDVAMFVTSAYIKPNLPPSLPSITMATLISNTARKIPITKPKK